MRLLTLKKGYMFKNINLTTGYIKAWFSLNNLRVLPVYKKWQKSDQVDGLSTASHFHGSTYQQLRALYHHQNTFNSLICPLAYFDQLCLSISEFCT